MRWDLVLVVGVAAVSPVSAQANTGKCPPDHRSPLLSLFTPIRTLKLATSDSAPIASLTAVRATTHGVVAVLDRRDYNIKLYGPDGHPKRVIGRRGAGPGEFSGPAAFTLVGDSLLTVADEARGRLVVYDTAGVLVSEHPLRGRPIGGIAQIGSQLLVTGFTGLEAGPAGVRLGEVLRLPSFGRTSFGELPESYQAHPVVLSSQVFVAGGHGVAYVTWRFSAHVYRVTLDGAMGKGVSLPTSRTFVDPRGVTGGRTGPDLFRELSPILNLYAVEDLILVPYLPRIENSGRNRPVRYHVLDTAFSVIATGIAGPGIVGAAGDTLLAAGDLVGGQPGDEQGEIHLTWLARCK